jgi:hypothetical protein
MPEMPGEELRTLLNKSVILEIRGSFWRLQGMNGFEEMKQLLRKELCLS